MSWIKKKTIALDLQGEQYQGNALIDLRNLDKVYHTDAGDFPALKNVNLEIGRGEFV